MANSGLKINQVRSKNFSASNPSFEYTISNPKGKTIGTFSDFDSAVKKKNSITGVQSVKKNLRSSTSNNSSASKKAIKAHANAIGKKK